MLKSVEAIEDEIVSLLGADFNREDMSALLADLKAAVRSDAGAKIREMAANPDALRPRRLDATRRTDYADDREWSAMIAEGSATL